MTPQYKVNSLTMEITRRCNKRCCHCMRGEAENLTMSTEIIDRVFDEVQNVQAVVIGNGEALLEMDTLEYFATKLLESPWTVSCEMVLTEGFSIDYSEEPPANAWKDYRRELHGYIKKLSG